MDASYPGPEAARAERPRDQTTQVTLETVAEGGPLAGVLEFLCRTMEGESVDRVVACIHPLNEDATMFRDTAAPSLDKSYREAVDGVLVSSMIGPCHAAATRQTVVVPEVAADPRWVRFLEFAGPLGIRSCWSTPIFSNDGKVLGTFAHYYFEARDPSPRDVYGGSRPLDHRETSRPSLGRAKPRRARRLLLVLHSGRRSHRAPSTTAS